ncbi:MAG TPA: bifunctional serine/threonine-protein kinase/formylglycine-generating enzyme family protein [Pseudomonadota bacterium]|nr:bifunctional serine/threonine-protein kinase/formylglycine-generating enzyme family protein [Pseudomonadota bacterium]
MKPGNILITTRPGGAEFVKILDFGIAKLHADQKQTATNMVLGTPLYMAPEQWENRADMDGRVDIYALGMILYECLTGTYPFTATTALQLMYAHSRKPVPDPGERAELPERLRRLVLDMVKKTPEERPASMGVVEGELAQILAELGGGGRDGAAGDAVAFSQVPAGPPRPVATTGDPVLSVPAEPAMTGAGPLAASLGGAAGAPPADVIVAGTAASPAAAPPRKRRLLPVVLGGAALLCLAALAAVGLTLVRGQVGPGRKAGPLPGPATPAAPSPGEPATPLVEFGPGRFSVGRAGPAGLPDGPPYSAAVDRFALETYEVSAAQVAEYVRATHQPDLASSGGNLPAVRLTRAQANSYCAWRHRGGRLPTEIEWEYAARDGRSDRLYPWPSAGAETPPAALSLRANVGSARSQLEPVDSRSAGRTPRGLYNLLGNAAEWTLSDSAPYPGSRAPIPRGRAVVRGGSAVTPAPGLFATTRQFVPEDTSDSFIGFRCAVSRK